MSSAAVMAITKWPIALAAEWFRFALPSYSAPVKSARRAAALQECNHLAQRYPLHEWGNTQIHLYRTCIASPGAISCVGQAGPRGAMKLRRPYEVSPPPDGPTARWSGKTSLRLIPPFPAQRTEIK